MIYHALAEVLAGPTPGIQNLLLEAATTGAQLLDSAVCQQVALTLAELPAVGLEALHGCYARLINNPGRRPVALYESLHRQGCLMGQLTREVEQRYQMLGLAPVDGELPDHASVELAYLGHLVEAEAEARLDGNRQLVARLKAEYHYFLCTHVGTWLPEVGSMLAAAGDSFYAAVGHLLGGFLTEELTSRKRNGQTRARFPTLKDPATCTLCGLCVGSCPLGGLQVIESATETALMLDPAQCIGCNRCVRTCPEGALHLSSATRIGNKSGAVDGVSYQLIRQSPRAQCPNCGRPTVSQAELEAVFARLQPDLATQQRLYLCVECKSLSFG
jgi:ferredoxin